VGVAIKLRLGKGGLFGKNLKIFFRKRFLIHASNSPYPAVHPAERRLGQMARNVYRGAIQLVKFLRSQL
jgi:hypothetical protein